MSEIIDVAVAAIVNSNHEVLISRRHKDTHQGGLWEFPGGKVDAGELIEQALKREIKEELAVDIKQARRLITLQHEYDDRTVKLQVYKVNAEDNGFFASPAAEHLSAKVGAEGQALKWQAIQTLDSDEFPAADSSIITALKLPNVYLITGDFISLDDFTTRLQAAINHGITMIQLRLKSQQLEQNRLLLEKVLQCCLVLCEQHDVCLMLNIPQALAEQVATLIGNNNVGFHFDSRRLQSLSSEELVAYRQNRWLSVSCHNHADIQKSARLGIDFMVLSPVQKTASHPDAEPLGWEAFSNYVSTSRLPVYALGGLDEGQLETAWLHGAQGIAGIGFCW